MITEREIKIKRVDNLVIVVADNILQKTLPEGSEDDYYSELLELVEDINSGLLGFRKLEETKEKLLLMMKKPKSLGTIEKGSLVEAYELAEGTEEKEERVKKMKKVSTVHDKFEYDTEGYVFLKNHSVPLPMDLANAILDAHYNPESKYTVESLVNFWQWAVLNPNDEARNDLFGWFKTGNFSITDNGLIVAYRCVAVKKQGKSNDLTKLIETEFVKIKKWKKSPKHYAVVKKDFSYEIESLKKNPHCVDEDCFVGVLSDLYAELDSNTEGDVYTDNHTKTMTIKIGEEVSMPRKDCDEQRNNQCSRGLHFMSKKYGLRLGGQKLIVLVNPMNIVAFPSYDNTKGRCCAYLPVAKALEDENGDFEEFDNGTFDFEYAKYTTDKLNELIETEGLDSLKSKGLISNAISSKDFHGMQDHFSDLLKDKEVYV